MHALYHSEANYYTDIVNDITSLQDSQGSLQDDDQGDITIADIYAERVKQSSKVHLQGNILILR